MPSTIATDLDEDLETWDQFGLAVRAAQTERPDLSFTRAVREALHDWIAATAIDLHEHDPFQPSAAGPVEPPVGFAHHHGPRNGPINVPARLHPDNTNAVVDLDNPATRHALYRTVLTHGTSDDLFTYLDPATLLDGWDLLAATVDITIQEQWGPWIARQRLEHDRTTRP